MPRKSKGVRLRIIKLNHQNWSIYAISIKQNFFTSTITRINQRCKKWNCWCQKFTRKTKKNYSKNGQIVVRAANKHAFFTSKKFKTEISFPIAPSTIHKIHLNTTYQLKYVRKISLWSPEIGSKNWSSAEKIFLIFHKKRVFFRAKQ